MAETVELEQVVLNIESAIPRQLLLRLNQAAISEIDHLTAAGTDQMMMVFYRSSHHIAAASAPGMDPAYQIELAQDIKGAVNSDKPDTGVQQLRLLVYIFRSQMVVAGGHYLQYYVALRSQFMPVLPENTGDFIFG